MKIGKTFSIEECNKNIMELVAGILPDPSGFPETKITIYVSDHKEKSIDSVKWAVELTQPLEEFASLVMKQGKVKKQKKDMILIIGDERVPNGLYLLYSQLEARILQCKFHTKEEALMYSSVNRITHFKPFYMTKSFARYPWFDGTNRHPDEYGYQAAQISAGIQEDG